MSDILKDDPFYVPSPVGNVDSGIDVPMIAPTIEEELAQYDEEHLASLRDDPSRWAGGDDGSRVTSGEGRWAGVLRWLDAGSAVKRTLDVAEKFGWKERNADHPGLEAFFVNGIYPKDYISIVANGSWSHYSRTPQGWKVDVASGSNGPALKRHLEEYQKAEQSA